MEFAAFTARPFPPDLRIVGTQGHACSGRSALTAVRSMELVPGARVTRRSSGEYGVVLAVADGALVEVAMASGAELIHRDDLALAPRDPLPRLCAGEVGEAERFGLFLRSYYLQHAYRFDSTASLSNARIEPQLHQIYIAHRVAHRKLRPRMILADEVGLGKTIEAGLIVKELIAREMVGRVLVLCPASLRFQWQQELQRKFNERFEIFDGDAIKHYGRGENPWTKANRVIASLPFAAIRTSDFIPPGTMRQTLRQPAGATRTAVHTNPRLPGATPDGIEDVTRFVEGRRERSRR